MYEGDDPAVAKPEIDEGIILIESSNVGPPAPQPTGGFFSSIFGILNTGLSYAGEYASEIIENTSAYINESPTVQFIEDTHPSKPVPYTHLTLPTTLYLATS